MELVDWCYAHELGAFVVVGADVCSYSVKLSLDPGSPQLVTFRDQLIGRWAVTEQADSIPTSG